MLPSGSQAEPSGAPLVLWLATFFLRVVPAATSQSHLPHPSLPSGTGRIVCRYFPYKGSKDTQ